MKSPVRKRQIRHVTAPEAHVVHGYTWHRHAAVLVDHAYAPQRVCGAPIVSNAVGNAKHCETEIYAYDKVVRAFRQLISAATSSTTKIQPGASGRSVEQKECRFEQIDEAPAGGIALRLVEVAPMHS